MQFQPENAVGVIELENAIEVMDEVVLPIEDVTSDASVGASRLGGRIMCNSPLMIEPSMGGDTQFGHIIKPPERLTYAPAVELRS
jgi:hypothetical protein